jgi:hypothetical protein
MLAQHVVIERTDPSLVPREREPEGMGRVDQRARQVVRVDLPALVVEIFEDLFADDPLFHFDVVERGFPHDFAEERRRRVHGLGGKRERKDAEIGVRGGVEEPAQLLEGKVDGVGVGQPVGAPINHVLEEMADAVAGRGLEA